MNRPLKKISRLLSSLFIAQLGMPSALCAQYDFQKIKEQQKKHIELTKDYHTMKEPVEFPDLPPYNGQAKFVTGFYSPNQNGVSACHMQFMAQEDPQTVIAFYKEALSANSWKIQYASIHGLSARHAKGHMCNINVNNSKMPKTKSTFTIDYRQIEPQH